jgi:Pyruvate/2-oxoacid:ferredoxin oxidoreductase delta subunit
LNTEIFYYSGTGFTLEAAKIAASAIGGEIKLTPIVGAMKRIEKVSNARRIGLFMPMHAFGMPKAFDEFLNTYRFPGAEYLFALVTRGGAPTVMHRKIDIKLKKQKKRLNAFGYATAPNTFDIVYRVHDTPKMAQGRANFADDIRRFSGRIRAGESFIDRGYRNWALETLLFPTLRGINRATGYFRLQEAFYADSKCSGCGTCEHVCLSGKIRMVDGKPEWQKSVSCQFCLACVNLCPEEAIQVRNSRTSERPRIHFPGVDVREIAAQKKS